MCTSPCINKKKVRIEEKKKRSEFALTRNQIDDCVQNIASHESLEKKCKKSTMNSYICMGCFDIPKKRLWFSSNHHHEIVTVKVWIGFSSFNRTRHILHCDRKEGRRVKKLPGELISRTNHDNGNDVSNKIDQGKAKNQIVHTWEEKKYRKNYNNNGNYSVYGYE